MHQSHDHRPCKISNIDINFEKERNEAKLLTLPSSVAAAKVVAAWGDQATSPTGLPRSKTSTGCKHTRDFNRQILAFKQKHCAQHMGEGSSLL